MIIVTGVISYLLVCLVHVRGGGSSIEFLDVRCSSGYQITVVYVLVEVTINQIDPLGIPRYWVYIDKNLVTNSPRFLSLALIITVQIVRCFCRLF